MNIRATKFDGDSVSVTESSIRKRLSSTIAQSYGPESMLTSRALFTCLLLRVREFVFSEIELTLKALDLTHTRYQVLSILCRTPEGLQLGEIAARTFVQPSTMTSTIDRLTGDGLIVRRNAPRDRRSVLAIATPKGHQTYKQARAALADAEFGLLEIDDETIEMLVDRLDRVALVMEQKRW